MQAESMGGGGTGEGGGGRTRASVTLKRVAVKSRKVCNWVVVAARKSLWTTHAAHAWLALHADSPRMQWMKL